MLISVITAVYNGEKYLEQTIQSVLQQTYPNIEYIIIDGGSTDNTLAIIKKNENRLTYHISEKDSGVYDAWNKGIAKAKGDWIVFLGADDFFLNERIVEEVAVDLKEAAAKNIRYVYGKVNFLSLTGEKVISVLGQPWKQSKKDIFRYMSVPHCAAFHHKSLFEDHGSFDKTFRISGDYDFLLREFAKGGNALFINKCIAGMRMGGLSGDLGMKLTLARENIKAIKNNQLPVSFYHKVQVYKAHLANFLVKLIGIRALKKISDIYRRIKGKDELWSKYEKT